MGRIALQKRSTRQKYLMHHVAPPGTFQLDIMFEPNPDIQKVKLKDFDNPRFAYLIAIDVTTRRVWYEEINHGGEEKKSKEVVQNAVVQLLDQLQRDRIPINVVRCDREKAFEAMNNDGY
jgi:hypothetical protein